jgi:Tfp pilus assembly protein PilO
MAKQLPPVPIKELNLRRLFFVRRFLVLAIVMGVVAVAIVLFALLPQVQQIAETQGIITRENGILQNLQRKIVALSQVNDLAEYANRDKVNEALPIQKPLLQLLETARRVSGESGARITSIETAPGKLASISAQRATPPADPSAPAAAAPVPIAVNHGQVHGVDKMDLTVTIQGNINQISDFIARIEKSTPVTNVTEIQLTDLLSTTTGPAEFSAELRLSSYYFTRAIEVAVDAPLPETGVKERAFLQELEQYVVTEHNAQSSQVEGGGREDLFGVGQ